MINVNRGLELSCPMCPKMLRYVTSRSADGSVHHKGDRFRVMPTFRSMSAPRTARSTSARTGGCRRGDSRIWCRRRFST